MTPPKGSTDHLLRSTPTTSMCATSSSAFEGSGRRCCADGRPRRCGRERGQNVGRNAFFGENAGDVFGGGLLVARGIRSVDLDKINQPVLRFLAKAVVSPTGEGLRNAAGAFAKCLARPCEVVCVVGEVVVRDWAAAGSDHANCVEIRIRAETGTSRQRLRVDRQTLCRLLQSSRISSPVVNAYGTATLCGDGTPY